MSREDVRGGLKSGLITVFAFLFGVLTGLVGVGPGFIGAIGLLFLFGLSATNARALVSVLILASAIPAILVYYYHGDVYWAAALCAAAGSFAGALVVSVLLRGRSVPLVRRVVALAVVAAGVEVVLIAARSTPAHASSLSLVLALAVGGVAGFVGSISGLAGGKILVPLLVIFFAVPQHFAQGTALGAIIPASALLSLGHYTSGRVEKRGLDLHIVAAAIGGTLGALLAVNLGPIAMGIVFGCFIIVSGGIVFARTSV